MKAVTHSLHAGFTLVELMIVLAILVTVSSLGIVRYQRVVDQAEEVVAEKQLKDIFDALLLFEQQNGYFPGSLDELGLGPLLDPWGNPYQYLSFSGGGAPEAGNTAGKGDKGKGGDKVASGDHGAVGDKRKDKFLVPINTYFDLFSMGPDGESVPPLTAETSLDDIIVANDGNYIGVASGY